MKKSISLFIYLFTLTSSDSNYSRMAKNYRHFNKFFCFRDITPSFSDSLFGLAVLAFSLLIPNIAYAYIDPGAGSALVALLAAGFTGLIVTLRLWRTKIQGWLSGKDKDSQQPKVSAPSRTDCKNGDSHSE